MRTSEPSEESKLDVLRATPLIVTRLRLDSGLGVGRESDGGSAATLVTGSRSGKGAPTGVGRRQRMVFSRGSGGLSDIVGRVPALAWWHLAQESFDYFVEIVKEK